MPLPWYCQCSSSLPSIPINSCAFFTLGPFPMSLSHLGGKAPSVETSAGCYNCSDSKIRWEVMIHNSASPLVSLHLLSAHLKSPPGCLNMAQQEFLIFPPRSSLSTPSLSLCTVPPASLILRPAKWGQLWFCPLSSSSWSGQDQIFPLCPPKHL